MDFSIQCGIALFISLLGFVHAGDYCYGDDGFEYCSNGCCGDYHSPCCNEKVAAIVGGCIGGLLFISLLVVVFCCCYRRRGAQGTVLRNQQQVMVNTVQYPGVMYPSANATTYPPQPMVGGAYPQQPIVGGAYPQQPYVGGAYPQQPPPYQAQQTTAPQGYQPNPQGYSNAGFSSDATGNQTMEKQEPTAPAN